MRQHLFVMKELQGYLQTGRILDELDEEDRELLIGSWENTLRLTKRMAKQKFTPKKYRD